MAAGCSTSTFTPPGSVFQNPPEHVLDWAGEVKESVTAEVAILHAKSTLTMSQWNCHCKKITCIKIRQQQNQQFCPSTRTSMSTASSTTSSPVINKNRKYIARLTSSHGSPHCSPTMRRISQSIAVREASPLPSITLRSPSTNRRQRRHLASYSQYLTGHPNLPSYARVADSLDHVLRICSRLRELLMLEIGELDKEETKEEIINKAKALVYVLQRSAYAFHLFDKTYSDNSGLLECLENISQIESSEDLPQVTKAFIDIVKKLIEETVHLNCWIIIHYLDDCDPNDCLLPVSLNHLIHLLLFESEPCLEVIQSNTMQNLLAICEMPVTPTSTVQLLLRAVAVLCGVRAACIQLLSLGGFSLILDYFLHSSVECSIEAAGVLCQLTRPNYGLIELGKNGPLIVDRLLYLVDQHCHNSDSLLFCLNVLANIASGINSDDSEVASSMFEQSNAIKRILKIINKPGIRSIFVDEQLLSILLHFPDSVPQTNALPFLFSIINQDDKGIHIQRLRQKAKLCLRLIGSSSEEEETFLPIKIRSSSSSSAGFHSSPTSVQESSTS